MASTIPLEVRRLSGSLGAEVRGLALAKAGPAEVERLKALLLEHLVLFFPDQHLSPDEHVAFGRLFGPLEAHPNLDVRAERPEFFELRAVDGAGAVADEWHSDLTCQASPSQIAILQMKTCPAVGGDTMWANMVLAYEMLPARIKERIENLYARHSFEHIFAAQLRRERRLELAVEQPSTDHPVVRVHPETGEKLLYVNQAFTTHFTNYYNFDDVRFGQDFAIEANTLMNYLMSQPAIPEYQVRLKWRPGTIAMWDNLLTQHYAIADYGPEPRKMLRATLSGLN
mgnify:CR=1 FL=1